MNKKELIRRVAGVMRENNVRKPVFSPKHVFHISDDEGNTKDFIIKQTDKDVGYTNDDVASVIDACIYVIEDALKKGEDITVHGFGTLELRHRMPTVTRHPITGEVLDIEGHYSPKFTVGKDLKLCAKLYELSMDYRDDTNDLLSFDEAKEGDVNAD